MFRSLQQIIYVRIMRDSFELLHVRDNRSLHQSATKPFSTARLAVGEFEHAEAALGTAMKSLGIGKIILLAPEIIMHQLYLAEGGLCQVEARILRELAQSVGARKVHIWQGEVLSREQILRGVHLGT